MYFLIKDGHLLEKYNTIWDKVTAPPLKKEFDSKPVFNKMIFESKTKSNGDEVTNVFNKEIPKVDSNYTCLAVISLETAAKKDENHYPEGFLKECQYSEKKRIRCINDNLRDFSSSDGSDKE